MQNHKNIAASLSGIIKSWLLCPAMVLLLAASGLAAESVPAYFYPNSSDDVPAMSAAMPAVVTEVYFKAAQMFGNGTVSAWPSDGFYPAFWSANATTPLFTATINSDANYTFSTDTAALAQAALTSGNWTASFTGGLTVDSELNYVQKVGANSLGGNMKAFMTSMRQFANDAGKPFSFYLGSRYLGTGDTYVDPKNPYFASEILGNRTASPQNYLLMPTYVDDGGPDTLGRLTTAVSALSTYDVAYKWILEIDAAPVDFERAVDLLVNNNGLIDPTKGYSGIALYPFNPTFSANIAPNLLYLNGRLQELYTVPEPKTVCLLLAALAALLFFRKFSAAKE